MRSIILAPSMMCVPQWQNPGTSLAALERVGVGLLHMDVMDGVFVSNLMLKTGKYSVLEAALESGFRSSSGFHRASHKITGKKPTEHLN